MACNERLKNPHFKSAQNAYNNTAQTMAATSTPVNVLGILNTDTGCSIDTNAGGFIIRHSGLYRISYDVTFTAGACRHAGKRSGSGDEELTKEDAMSWMYNMKNEDGSFGAHWDLEQTRPYMEPRGVTCELWKWAAVMNMMYSDYCKAARKNSVDRPEFYADLAAAFLEDKDAPEDKAGRYYHNIAAVQE